MTLYTFSMNGEKRLIDPGGGMQITRLRKDEILWLAKHRCHHGHTYLEHQRCAVKEKVFYEQIGVLDIECSGLKADFGIILAWSVLNLDTGKIKSRRITKTELTTCLDKKLVGELVEEIGKYDRLVTYYGSRFDLPFIRIRALHHKLDFPGYQEITHTDLYFLIKYKFGAMSRRSLDNACRILTGKSRKTRLLGDQWTRALAGDKKSLTYILDHNIKDVQDTAKLYRKVLKFGRKARTSI